MKNQILDKPFRDAFSDFLEKGEKILWTGKPEIKKANENPIETLFEAIDNVFSLQFFTNIFWKIFTFGKKQKIKYAISEKRVLLSFHGYFKKGVYEIPFSNIKDLVEVEVANHLTTIFFSLKNTNQVNFDTYELIEGRKTEKRHQPTFENIKNSKQVIQLIREGIKNNA